MESKPLDRNWRNTPEGRAKELEDAAALEFLNSLSRVLKRVTGTKNEWKKRGVPAEKLAELERLNTLASGYFKTWHMTHPSDPQHEQLKQLAEQWVKALGDFMASRETADEN